MREALTSVLDLGFAELDLVKVEAEVFTENSRSIRLVEGVGTRREGTIRSPISNVGIGSTPTSTAYFGTSG